MCIYIYFSFFNSNTCLFRVIHLLNSVFFPKIINILLLLNKYVLKIVLFSSYEYILADSYILIYRSNKSTFRKLFIQQYLV